MFEVDVGPEHSSIIPSRLSISETSKSVADKLLCHVYPEIGQDILSRQYS